MRRCFFRSGDVIRGPRLSLQLLFLAVELNKEWHVLAGFFFFLVFFGQGQDLET